MEQKALARGQFVVALALIERGTVTIGAIGCPRLGLTGVEGVPEEPGGVAVAVRGRGAWWTPLSGGSPVRLRVSENRNPAEARIADSVETAHSDRSRQQAMLQALACRAAPVLMDSQAKHVAVAAGMADVLVRFPRPGYREAIWDQAAGTILIEEAGGRVSDLSGRPFDFSTGRRLTQNEGVLATNGLVHDAVLSAVGGGSTA
ncbi:MAG: inositol monophosphatase family protein [Vicinamibacterales bacterium]